MNFSNPQLILLVQDLSYIVFDKPRQFQKERDQHAYLNYYGCTFRNF